jgi:hypothetical protein
MMTLFRLLQHQHLALSHAQSGVFPVRLIVPLTPVRPRALPRLEIVASLFSTKVATWKLRHYNDLARLRLHILHDRSFPGCSHAARIDAFTLSVDDEDGVVSFLDANHESLSVPPLHREILNSGPSTRAQSKCSRGKIAV